jgi:hypothetical protein
MSHDNAGRRILILVHEHDGYPHRKVHQIWSMADLWREEGLDVRVVKGPRDPAGQVDADLVIPHVNLSVVPQEYRAWLERHPRVLNAGVYDITKRAVSTFLVSPEDAYDGPVVVKTNLNYGGLPELAMEHRRRQATLLGRVKRRLFGARQLQIPKVASLDRATVMHKSDYRLFESKRDVPRGVFDNPNLVVQQLLSEPHGDLFCVRSYSFCGDRYVCELHGYPDRLRKSIAPLQEPCEPHPGILRIRERMGWDYGKLDYVMRDGRVVLFDANKTLGCGDEPEVTLERARRLAPGIHSVLNAPDAYLRRAVA